MHVFVTGATGFLGGAIMRELITAGHKVTGLARSDEGAAVVNRAGAQVWRGSLEDVSSLAAAAQSADATINAASPMSFGPERGEIERAAVMAMLDALEGSGKRFLYTSDQLIYGPTGAEPATEDRPLAPLPFVIWRAELEPVVLAAEQRGVQPLIARPVALYGHGRDHLLPMLIAKAREQGYAFHIGDGAARWSMLHVDDAAHGYRLVLERGAPGMIYNLSPDRATTMRELGTAVAAAAGSHVDVRPISLEEAESILGPFASNFTFNLEASGARARNQLGWRATGPSLLEEARAGVYSS